MADWGRKKHTRRPLNHLASEAICQLEGGDVEHLESMREQRCTAVPFSTHKQRPMLPLPPPIRCLAWLVRRGVPLCNWAPHVSMIKTTVLLSFTLSLLTVSTTNAYNLAGHRSKKVCAQAWEGITGNSVWKCAAHLFAKWPFSRQLTKMKVSFHCLWLSLGELGLCVFHATRYDSDLGLKVCLTGLHVKKKAAKSPEYNICCYKINDHLDKPLSWELQRPGDQCWVELSSHSTSLLTARLVCVGVCRPSKT